MGARVAVLAGLVGLVGCLPGCGGCGTSSEYPADFPFPARTDRLVLALPQQPAPGTNTAGKRDEEIAELDARGGRTADPAAIPADARASLDRYLADTFGTPADPNDVSAGLKLTKAHLAEGARLYKRHCLDCHNIDGDGRGAKSGTFQVPFPRDYRQGAFKFTSSGEGGKPRRADLLRTIHDGLRGTAMPAFALLQEGERDLMAGYVTYLSVRGQVEFESLRALLAGQPNDPAERLNRIVGEWERAEAAPPLPPEPSDGAPGSAQFSAAVRRGHELFVAKAENSCVGCHGDYGRQPVLRYDVWGTVAKPANLTEPHLKGGARPEDVFARIRFGIPAVGMPAHPAPKYTERDVWDLVRFVTAAPYRDRLPDDVRAAVYPPSP
jgi:mono/diheme cytochrome c family protein